MRPGFISLSPHIIFLIFGSMNILFHKEGISDFIVTYINFKTGKRRIIMNRVKLSKLKRWMGLFSAACLSALVALPMPALGGDTPGPDAAQANADIPEVIDINLQHQCGQIKGLPADKKEVAGFSHAKHAQEYLKGKEKFSPYAYTAEFTCTACHTTAKSPDAITKDGVCQAIEEELEKQGGAGKMANYFHHTCKSCHSAMKKAKEKTGPTSCRGCHK